MTDEHPETQHEWDARYSRAERLWSGKPNQAVIDGVSCLLPGHAIDLGCGEGGDAIWLAQQGWTVTGIDFAPSAITRARAAAERLSLPPDATRFIATDLASWQPDDGPYDLVTTSFLHLPDLYGTDGIIRRTIRQLRPGGHLLAVSHAERPPWLDGDHTHDHAHAEHTLCTPDEQLDALALDPALWQVRLAEVRSRPATGPDGQPAQLKDSVLLVERRSV